MLNSVPTIIASYLVNSAWEVALITATGWLASQLLKRLGPQAEHIVWVSALFLAVLMPAFPALRWLPAILHIPFTSAEHLSITLVAAQDGEPIQKSIRVLPSALGQPLFCLYLILLSYFAVRLALSVHRTNALRSRSIPLVLTPQQDEIWRDCERSFCLGAIRMLSASQLSGPVTFGLRVPVLLIPVGFAGNCQSQDLLAALGHECAHIKRRDFMKNLFYEISSLILAFHPATWIIKSRIAQTREIVCDGMVTERLIDSRGYAQSLLRLAMMVTKSSQASAVHAIGIFDANILEKRIMNLHGKRQQISPAYRYALIIPATLCLLTAAIGAAAMAVVVEPQSAQAADESKSYGHVYHVGKDVTAPVVVQSTEAEFPESGREIKAPFNAIVLIGLVVDASGMPRDVHVVRSYKPDFDAKAIQAVQRYRFKPAMRLQKPVAVAMSIEVNFGKY